MSRETDSPSSGPRRRRGGSTYPQGTEPYGSAGEPPEGEAEPDGAPETTPEEPRTETTLTTKIKINIPGARPIPPVVMRTPVGDEEGQRDSGGTRGSGGTGTGRSARDGAAPTDPPRPTRSVTRSATPVTPTPPAAPPAAPPGGEDGAGDTGAGPNRPTYGADPYAAGGAAPTASGGESAGGGEFTTPTSDWFAPRKSSRGSGAGAPPPPPASADAGPSSEDTRTDLPYFSGGRPGEPESHPGAGPPGAGMDSGADDWRTATPPDGSPAVGPLGPPGSLREQPGPGSGPHTSPAGGLDPLGLDSPSGSGAPAEHPYPGGPTSGPGTGDMPLASPWEPSEAAGQRENPFADLLPRDTGTSGPDPHTGGVPHSGEGPGAPYPGEGPDAPAPVAEGAFAGDGGPSGADGGHITSDTLVSGIPRVPPEEGAARPADGTSPFPSAAPPAGGGEDDGAAKEPAASGSGGASAAKGRPSKGRSKLVLAGACLFGAVGVAYGAGLLFDHADVPNGTTALGVDIGGSSKHEAVNKLDEALGKRATAPFTVQGGGQKSQIKPSVAGLTLDNEATVRNAAGRDYNPVSVIGSLFGVDRVAEPAIKVDDEKMRSALTQFASGGKGGQDGMVKFVGGKPVAVKGKPYKGVDPDKAGDRLEEAYRERATTGKNPVVALPVTEQQPKIGDRELKQAVNGFGKDAMSGWLWLKAGNVTVPFSQETMGKFLTMQRGGKTLQPVIDPKALKKTYGTAFDDVVIDAANGTVKMTPDHAAVAMVEALRKPAEKGEKRTAVVRGARGG